MVLAQRSGTGFVVTRAAAPEGPFVQLGTIDVGSYDSVVLSDLVAWDDPSAIVGGTRLTQPACAACVNGCKDGPCQVGGLCSDDNRFLPFPCLQGCTYSTALFGISMPCLVCGAAGCTVQPPNVVEGMTLLYPAGTVLARAGSGVPSPLINPIMLRAGQRGSLYVLSNAYPTPNQPAGRIFEASSLAPVNALPQDATLLDYRIDDAGGLHAVWTQPGAGNTKVTYGYAAAVGAEWTQTQLATSIAVRAARLSVQPGSTTPLIAVALGEFSFPMQVSLFSWRMGGAPVRQSLFQATQFFSTVDLGVAVNGGGEVVVALSAENFSGTLVWRAGRQQTLADMLTGASTLSAGDHLAADASLVAQSTFRMLANRSAIRSLAVLNVAGTVRLGIRDAGLDTEDHSISLRAERAGGGGGRTYTLTYQVSDAAGNRSERSVTVVVRRGS